MNAVREEPARFYTVKELADMWHVNPITVRVWLLRLRRDGQGPRKDQAKRKRKDRIHWHVLIRSDYALLIQGRYVTR